MNFIFKIANYYGLEYKIYDNGTIIGPERGIISQRENHDGYMEVTLGTSNNRHSRVRVHRVIAEQFIPNPFNLPEVNHIDCNRKNNNASNLEWVSHQKNIEHSAKLGHYSGNKCGEKNGRAIITWDIANEIRVLYRCGYSIKEISKQYNISRSTVGNVVHNLTWTV